MVMKRDLFGGLFASVAARSKGVSNDRRLYPELYLKRPFSLLHVCETRACGSLLKSIPHCRCKCRVGHSVQML